MKKMRNKILRRIIFVFVLGLCLSSCSQEPEVSDMKENRSVSDMESFDDNENETEKESEDVSNLAEEEAESLSEKVEEELSKSDFVEEETEEVTESVTNDSTTTIPTQYEAELQYTATVLDKHIEITDDIPACDLATLNYIFSGEGEGDFLFFGFVEDGSLYYHRSTDYGFIYSSNEDKNWDVLPGITDIRRIKTFNTGTGVDPTPCLIMETGEVYWLCNTDSFNPGELTLSRFWLLKDYQVEDILFMESEWSYHMEILLKDGSVVEIQSESWDN